MITLKEALEYLGNAESRPSKFGDGITFGKDYPLLTLKEATFSEDSKYCAERYKGKTICFYTIETSRESGKCGSLETEEDLEVLNPWRVSQMTFDLWGDNK